MDDDMSPYSSLMVLALVSWPDELRRCGLRRYGKEGL